MKRMPARIRGAFYITRQSFHTLTHILLGIVWFYFLKQFMSELTSFHLFLSLLGSLLPDCEHLIYFYIRGRKDTYSKNVRVLIHDRKWRELTLFLRTNHKSLTTLRLHSIQWIVVLVLLALVSFAYDYKSPFVFLGAMVSHYVFDIVDDFIFLGRLNPNWYKGFTIKRWFMRVFSLSEDSR